MSMSQEEIEALMNGLDITEDENPSEEVVEDNSEETQDDTPLSMEEIENLVSEAQDVNQNNETVETNDEEFDIDSLVNEMSNSNMDTSSEDTIEDSTQEISNDELDELINSDISTSNGSLEDLANVVKEIDTKEDEPVKEEVKETKKVSTASEDDFQNWADNKINEGKIPIPAESDAKVVNQLSQVANDSEEKVSQIFDVLSSTLDSNNEIRNILTHTTEVLESQKALMETLNVKFPNVDVFGSKLEEIKSLNANIDNINNHLLNEDNDIFQAMELMQFNDINRQKIERVMSVIRKLSVYLNNLFEDEGSTQDVVVAKHIHGDNNDIVEGDDLEKLIDEFNKRV